MTSSLPVFEVPTYPGTDVRGGATAASQVCQVRANLTVDHIPELANMLHADTDTETPCPTPCP